MTWPDYIRRYARQNGLTLSAARQRITSAFALLADVDKDGLLVPGFGRFYRASLPPRTIRDPLTGGKLRIGETETIRFRSARGVKRRP